MRVDAGGVGLTTTNVSLRGMQLSCPGLLFGLLQPALDRGTVELTLFLPDNTAARTACAVAYVSHYGYEYLIGVSFLAFEDDGYERFRRACLEGAEEQGPAAPAETSAAAV